MLLFSQNTCLHDFSNNLKIKIYKTIILPVMLYGCETWSHIKGGMQMRVFEDMTLG